jgi:hypothetical protein
MLFFRGRGQTVSIKWRFRTALVSWCVGSGMTMTTARRSYVGTCNDNPIVNTRAYEFVFPDGEVVTPYDANTISENMYARCDLDLGGKQEALLGANIGHPVNYDAKPVHTFVFFDARRYPKKNDVISPIVCAVEGWLYAVGTPGRSEKRVPLKW